MPTHKAEQILVTVTDLLAGLDTTGDSVRRSRVYDWSDDELPGISVFMGADNPADNEARNIGFYDWVLQVRIEAACKSFNYSGIDTTLNAIRAEVTAALMLDHKMGLDFVIDTIEQGSDEPELTGEGEKPAARQVFTFTVKYRRSLGDPRQ